MTQDELLQKIKDYNYDIVTLEDRNIIQVWDNTTSLDYVEIEIYNDTVDKVTAYSLALYRGKVEKEEITIETFLQNIEKFLSEY